MASEKDRVEIWNSLFHQAWIEAKRLKEQQVGNALDIKFDPVGGRLTDEKQQILAILAVTALAIEARVNHMLHELVEKGRLAEDEARAAEHLPLLKKWILLPKLAGRRKQLTTDRWPHQAIAEIAGLRNDIVHARFRNITESQLPNTTKMLKLFDGFVEAMEDMNVRLGRARRPRKGVLKIGKLS